MNAFILFLTLLLAGSPEAVPTQAESTPEDPVWGSFQKVLDIGIKELKFKGKYGEFTHNAFDYKKLKNSSDGQALLKKQLELLKKTPAPTRSLDKLAFWMNAYNFFTVIEINNNFPVESMKDIGWRKVHHNVNGKNYSLDQIEHEIIRPLNDPRIHFAVNCASVSCPSLSSKIFVGQGIGRQMNELVYNAFKNPLHIRLEDGELQMTKLLDWFGKDFKIFPYKGTAKFIEKYAPKELHEDIEGWIKYDWDINDPEHVLKAIEKLGAKQIK